MIIEEKWEGNVGFRIEGRDDDVAAYNLTVFNGNSGKLCHVGSRKACFEIGSLEMARLKIMNRHERERHHATLRDYSCADFLMLFLMYGSKTDPNNHRFIAECKEFGVAR